MTVKLNFHFDPATKIPIFKERMEYLRGNGK
jgi:hypothetical protein